jgi:serine phosphatase RsbU (regulator of sigma subunit)
MVSVVCNNGLNRSVREFNLTEPGKILDKTREIVNQEFEKGEEEVQDGMDISLCVLNTKTNQLLWAGANNPIWIIRKDTGVLEEIKGDKQPVGVFANAKNFTTHSITLNKGDQFYIFTDGYQDQFGGNKGKKFKASQMKELLLSIQHESMEKQNIVIQKAFENWMGKLEQVDDMCFIGVRV